MNYPLGCDIHEMYTDYPLLIERMAFVACRTGQGTWEVDQAYKRHYSALKGKLPFIAWHVHNPANDVVGQVNDFLKIQPPNDGVLHCWDVEVPINSQSFTTDHLLKVIELTKQRTGKLPLIYSGPGMNGKVDWTRLPTDIQYWWAAYPEYNGVKFDRDAGGFTLVNEKLYFPLTLPRGIKQEQIVIHQATSSANGRLYGSWNGFGRVDVNFWLKGDVNTLKAWFAMQVGAAPLPPAPQISLFKAVIRKMVTPPLNVRSMPNASAPLVGELTEGTIVDVYDVSSKVIAKPWYRIGINMWIAGWFTDKVAAPPVPPTGNGLFDIVPLGQRNPQWANVHLGFSDTTIGRYGCLLTAVTMVANNLLSRAFTPADMNEIIKHQNGFVSGNLYRFAALAEAFPDKIKLDKYIATPLIPAPLNEIDAILARGLPVIVETRLFGSQHWVLIVGKNSTGGYAVNDPWTGTRIDFQSVYKEPARWIYKIVSYKKVEG